MVVQPFPSQKTSGQTAIEYVIMLSILTIIGIFIFVHFSPTDGTQGAIDNMSERTTNKIAEDE